MRRVLITGAAGYVGSHSIKVFNEAGYSVVGIDSAEDFAANMRDNACKDTHVCRIRADVTSLSEMAFATNEVAKRLGGLDVLICSAGVMDPGDGGIFASSEEAWERTFTVNIKGTRVPIKACLPFLLEGDAPAIVIVGSLVGLRGSSEAQLAYTASKGALSALARELAVSLAPRGVTVNCVCPGPLDGGLLRSRTLTSVERSRRTEAIPLGRLGTAHDVAEACLFLASTKARYISGAELVVDGGASAAFMVGGASDKRHGPNEVEMIT